MEHQTKPVVLIIDDDKNYCEWVIAFLKRIGADGIVVADLASAKQRLQQLRVNFVLSELYFGDSNVIELLAYLQNKFPKVPCSVVTAAGDVTTAVNALKQGAFDFVCKPISLETLQKLFVDGLKSSKAYSWRDPKEETLIASAIELEKLRQHIKSVKALEIVLERAVALATADKNVSVTTTSVTTGGDLPEQLDSLEKQKIMLALENNRWNKTAAAKALGISFRAMRYRIEKFNIK